MVLHAGIETRQVFVLEASPYLADALVLVLLDIIACLMVQHIIHSFIQSIPSWGGGGIWMIDEAIDEQ